MACSLAGLFLFGCAELQVDPVDENGLTTAEIEGLSSMSLMAIPADAEVIDFESYAAGAILSEVHSNTGVGPIGLYGFNPDFVGTNTAMIFDSSMPTGGDPDLGTPNEDFGGPGIGVAGEAGSAYENNTAIGKVLIISEDLDPADPDDAAGENVYFSFDFSALTNVTVYSMNVLDIESVEAPATVTFYDAANNVIGSPFNLPDPGDNGFYNQVFGEDGVAGVDSMVVSMHGSGAIDNIVFQSIIPPPPGEGCTRTLGYWKNHTQYSAAPRDATWDELGALAENTPFFLSGQTYLQVLQTEAGGNAYYILASQYIAATLNTLAEATTTTEVDDALSQAEWLFNTYTPAQIAALKGSSTLRQSFINYATILDDYNNGVVGPGHCADEEVAE